MTTEPEEADPVLEEAAPAEEGEASKAPSPTAKPRLTPAQWAAIERCWELGTSTLKQLEDEYGVTGSALHQHFKRYGIVRGSRADEIAETASAAAKAVAAKHAQTFAESRAKRIEDTRESSYQFDTAVSALNRSLIAQALKTGDPPSKFADDFKAIRYALLNNRIAREGRYKVLEIDTQPNENELPVITIRDMTATDISKVQRTHKDDELDLDQLAKELDDDNPIVSLGEGET